MNGSPGLVVGVGARRGVTAAELDVLVTEVLRDAGLTASRVLALATVADKCREPGVVAVAIRRGWPLMPCPATCLAAVRVPNPSEAARRAVATPSVAEAAALVVSGGTLVVPKTTSARATVAVARVAVRCAAERLAGADLARPRRGPS